MKRNAILGFLLIIVSIFYSEKLFAQGCVQLHFVRYDANPCVSSTPYFYEIGPYSGSYQYTWTITGGGYEMSGTNENFKEIKWTSAGQKTIRVSRLNCSSYDAVLTINVGSQAAVMPASITGNLAPCLGTSTYSVPAQAGQTYTWTLKKNGGIDTNNPTTLNGNQVSVNWTQSGYYQLEVFSNNGNCNSNILTANIYVGVYEPEVGSNNGTVDFACKNSSSTYTVANSGLFNSYSWAISPAGPTITPSGNVATVNWGSSAGPYTLSVTGTNSCGSSTKNITINLQTAPAKPVLTPSTTTTCLSQITPVYISQDPNATYYFINPISSYYVNLNNGNPYVPFLSNTAGSYTFSVIAGTSALCQSAPSDPVTIAVVDNVTLPVISGNQSICNSSSGQYTYSVQNSTANYKWTVQAGVCLLNGSSATSVIGNSVSITWLIAGVHTINVNPNVTTCNYPTATYQVTVQQPLTTADVDGIIGSTSVCLLNGAASKFPYRVDYANDFSSLNEGNSISWSVSSGGTIFETRPNSCSVQWTSPGTYTLTATISNSCGGSVVKTLTVTPIVTSSSVSNTTDFSGLTSVCPFELSMYHPVVASPSTYAWNSSGILSATTIVNANAQWLSSANNHFISYSAYNGTCYQEPFIKTINVSKRAQTITFSIGVPQVAGNTITLPGTASSGLPLYYTLSHPTLGTIIGNNLTLTGSGSLTIFAHQDGNGCYLPATTVSSTITISKASQNISFNAITARTYGDAPFDPMATASSGLPVTYTSSNPAVATVSGNLITIVGAGSVIITASQAGNSIYNAASPYTQVLYVSKANQTITFNTLSAKTYGNTPFTITATSSSGLPVTLSGISAILSLSGNTATILNAGTSSINASQAGNSNYYPADDVMRLQTINKAPLTVTADNKTRVYGVVNPVLTITYSGFVNGETATVIDTPPTASTTATPTSSVGTYPITLAGGLDNNYTISLTPGTLSITKASLQATADNKSRLYGAANPTFTISYSGFVNGETVSVIDTPPTASTTTTPMSNVGSYPIAPAGGLDNNYTFTFANGTLTVNKASLLATADNKSRSYGAPNPTFTISYSGFVNGETAAVIDTPPTASTSATATSNVSTYPINPSGGLDNNYTFTFANGTLTINKASILATADNKSRSYGAANPTFTISYSGFVNGETAAVIDTPPTASTSATATSNVSTYPINPSGGLDNNYTFTFANGTLTINKASILATAGNKSRLYGAANPTFTISYSGFVNGETAAVIDTPPTASTSATTTSNVSTYSIIPSGGLDNNYTFTFANGTLTINKASVLATADNKSRSYGAANPTFTLSYSGFVNGEVASVIDTPPAASTTATASSNSGTYPIVPSGGLDNNYSFAYANGTLTICAAGSIRQFGDLCANGYVDLRGGANPGSGSNYVWSTTQTTQTIQVYDAGTYSVTYINESGCSVSATILVELIPNPGPCIYARQASPKKEEVEKEDDSHEIRIYPNPANHEVNIELPAAVSKSTPIEMYDAFGRVVYQSAFNAGEKTKTVSTSNFADGIYMMQLITPQGSKVVRKVMVTHR